MKMSARTRSGERSGSLRIAASPLPTETTSIPWSFSASVTIFWMLLLSSATRTLATKPSTPHRPRTLRTPQAVTLRNLIPNTLQRVSQHEPDDVVSERSGKTGFPMRFIAAQRHLKWTNVSRHPKVDRLPGDNLSQTLLLLAGGLFLGVVFLVFVGVVWLGFIRGFRVLRLRAGRRGVRLGRVLGARRRGRRRARTLRWLAAGGTRCDCHHHCCVASRSAPTSTGSPHGRLPAGHESLRAGGFTWRCQVGLPSLSGHRDIGPREQYTM